MYETVRPTSGDCVPDFENKAGKSGVQAAAQTRMMPEDMFRDVFEIMRRLEVTA
jgi:hypothetical protein